MSAAAPHFNAASQISVCFDSTVFAFKTPTAKNADTVFGVQLNINTDV